MHVHFLIDIQHFTSVLRQKQFTWLLSLTELFIILHCVWCCDLTDTDLLYDVFCLLGLHRTLFQRQNTAVGAHAIAWCAMSSKANWFKHIMLQLKCCLIQKKNLLMWWGMVVFVMGNQTLLHVRVEKYHNQARMCRTHSEAMSAESVEISSGSKITTVKRVVFCVCCAKKHTRQLFLIQRYHNISRPFSTSELLPC